MLFIFSRIFNPLLYLKTAQPANNYIVYLEWIIFRSVSFVHFVIVVAVGDSDDDDQAIHGYLIVSVERADT